MPSEVRVGCSGWQYASWRGVLYPEGLAQRRWLARYAEVFDSVEVNATFYRLARPAAVQGWLDATPPGFRFAVKASRYLTHMKKLADLDQGLGRFYDAIAPLAASPKLGPVLWQLPGWFARDDDRLGDALNAITARPGLHAFEFRHPSWFAPPVYDLLRWHGVALVVGDHPERPWQPWDVLTAGWTFLRFHAGRRGRRGNYSARELDLWADRVAALRERAAVWAYFNNDWEGFAVRNAVALRTRVEAAGAGQRGAMSDQTDQPARTEDLTTEHGDLRETAGRTRPPANGETDEQAVEQGRHKLEQAGGGH
jgi:uncharacterized protein YecE (DUF72 family)